MMGALPSQQKHEVLWLHTAQEAGQAAKVLETVIPEQVCGGA